MTQRTLTDVDEAEIVTRYREGASTWALARRFEVGRATIGRVLDEHHVDRRPNAPAHPADTAQIMRLRAEGRSWADIADVVRMSPSGVRRRYDREVSRRVTTGGV